MLLTRKEFLAHVHQPLESSAGQSSPTKGKYRLRWRELREWDNFASDAQIYWDNLDDVQKNQELSGVAHNYWDVLYSSMAAVDDESVSREPDLATPFTNLYSAPHNQSIPGSSDDHARMSPRRPANMIGDPDGCLRFNNQVVGIIELKTFWKVTEDTIREVLEGLDRLFVYI
jgi:hypothetical protein